ncbi:hypothetical protein niasHT_002846 [Heterodera trifolii]|uniref:RING-type domain-containing protein n=1 Tax=Heterodera trifolii TaxID=157864 RepID=A0ABD2LQW7_9BILA
MNILLKTVLFISLLSLFGDCMEEQFGVTSKSTGTGIAESTKLRGKGKGKFGGTYEVENTTQQFDKMDIDTNSEPKQNEKKDIGTNAKPKQKKEKGLAQPKPTPENDIAHPTTADENKSSGEAQTAKVSGPSGHEIAGENTSKNGENSQPSKDPAPEGHKEAIASQKKPSPKSDWEIALSQKFAKLYQSPKRKTAISPVAKGKNIENTQSSKDTAFEAHKELAKEKNEEKAQTSKDATLAGSQNESIPSPKKPSPKGKSKSDFGLNLAKAFPRPVPKAKVGEEAQPSNDPTMNGQICAICLDASLITDLELSKCHHRFHRECVDGWFKNNDTCPYCRAVVASRYLPRPTRTDRIFDARIENKRRFMGEGEGKYTFIRSDGSTFIAHDNHFGNNFTVEKTENGTIRLSKNDRK